MTPTALPRPPKQARTHRASRTFTEDAPCARCGTLVKHEEVTRELLKLSVRQGYEREREWGCAGCRTAAEVARAFRGQR